MPGFRLWGWGVILMNLISVGTGLLRGSDWVYPLGPPTFTEAGRDP